MRDSVLETGSENRTGATVGSYLREVRESRGLSIDEAARVTRIGRNYLSALEGDLFENLPSTAYVKGFLRAYAVFLGLSGNEIVAMYERIASPPAVHSVEATRPRDPGGVKVRSRGRWFVPLLLLPVLAVTAYLSDEKRVKTEKPLSLATPQVTSAPSLVQDVRSSANQDRGHALPPELTRPIPSDSVERGTQPAGIVLRLKVNQDSSLNITIDGTVSQQYDLNAGDLIEWKAEKSFTLDVGNAGGIEGEFNGKPLKPFGETGRSAHIMLKAEGAEQ